MARKITIAICLVLLIAGGLAGVKMLQIRTLMAAGKSFVQPPEAVSSTTVRQEKWQNTLSAIGTMTAFQGVIITPELPGTITEIDFESGALVAKGDLLLRLDTSAEDAQLRALDAQAELARINLARERTLREQNMISQSELDGAEATLKQNQANADATRAAIEKKTIRAPFAGRLGIRMVNLGQYLDTGKPIVSLQSLAPIYVDFSLPQQELGRLKEGMKVRITTDAYPGREFDGDISAINPDLDQSTRSVSLQATFQNAEKLLRPGMFSRVEVLLPEEQDVLVIPATAVLSATYGDSVFIIESGPDKTSGTSALIVRQQFIRPGAARGDFVSVQAGLKPGERVVKAGAFKLRNGMSVIENNQVAPKLSETPNPPDS